jgi:hypothetical protein
MAEPRTLEETHREARKLRENRPWVVPEEAAYEGHGGIGDDEAELGGDGAEVGFGEG